MADDKKDGQELSEDEKLAAEWEAAMEESGGEGSEEPPGDEWAQAMEEAGETGGNANADANSSVRAAPMEEFDEGSMTTQ
ncbi:MAG: flagellar motor switch protein FliN, partial [Marinobacter sp.]